MNITDEQGVKWLLSKAYDVGNRYITMDEDGEIFLYKNKPVKGERTWIGDYSSGCICFYKVISPLVSWEDEAPFDIGKYLGIIDWENVPVDTKVLVSDDGKNWEKRYFKFYNKENNRRKSVCFADGRTSWSNKDNHEGIGWKYCKLAEDE